MTDQRPPLPRSPSLHPSVAAAQGDQVNTLINTSQGSKHLPTSEQAGILAPDPQ